MLIEKEFMTVKPFQTWERNVKDWRYWNFHGYEICHRYSSSLEILGSFWDYYLLRSIYLWCLSVGTQISQQYQWASWLSLNSWKLSKNTSPVLQNFKSLCPVVWKMIKPLESKNDPPSTEIFFFCTLLTYVIATKELISHCLRKETIDHFFFLLLW